MISARSSLYTLTRVLLVLVLFLANSMKKRQKNMLLLMHLKTITRLKTNTLHMRGSVLLLYESLYISGPIFMAPNSLCIPTTSLSNG
jgi:hypothetical protein